MTWQNLEMWPKMTGPIGNFQFLEPCLACSVIFSANIILKYFLLFPENRLWHFMQLAQKMLHLHSQISFLYMNTHIKCIYSVKYLMLKIIFKHNGNKHLTFLGLGSFLWKKLVKILYL